MSFVTWIAIFIMIWFIVLMPVINMGVKNLMEVGEKPVDGSDISAPKNAKIIKKFQLVTLITLGIWITFLVIYGFTTEAPFQNLFKQFR
jgi:predicted secreted protein